MSFYYECAEESCEKFVFCEMLCSAHKHCEQERAHPLYSVWKELDGRSDLLEELLSFTVPVPCARCEKKEHFSVCSHCVPVLDAEDPDMFDMFVMCLPGMFRRHVQYAILTGRFRHFIPIVLESKSFLEKCNIDMFNSLYPFTHTSFNQFLCMNRSAIESFPTAFLLTTKKYDEMCKREDKKETASVYRIAQKRAQNLKILEHIRV